MSPSKHTLVSSSKLEKIGTLENIKFGSTYTDHMLQAYYKNGAWQSYEIIPYGDIQVPPSCSALHYGQAIFEGMKAFKHQSKNQVGIFRIHDHLDRINISASRLQMPQLPKEIFLDGMKELIQLERNWVPSFEGHSLYIRPFMFADDFFLGVRPSESYRFMIIASPAASYYSRPIKVIVENSYSRAAKGGVGGVKAAGNYASSLFPTQLALKENYDQVLWTDAEKHEEVQEVGTMNIFFVFKDKVVTPSTEAGTILKGITRKSIISLIQKRQIKIEERSITIQEILSEYQKENLLEVFGSGTAVVINSVSELKYQDKVIQLNDSANSLSNDLKKSLNNIRYGIQEDTENWMTWI